MRKLRRCDWLLFLAALVSMVMQHLDGPFREGVGGCGTVVLRVQQGLRIGLQSRTFMEVLPRLADIILHLPILANPPPSIL